MTTIEKAHTTAVTAPPTTEPRPVRGRARCHECGVPTIVALCCACGRLLCGRHDRTAELTDAWRAARPEHPGPEPAKPSEPAADDQATAPVVAADDADRTEEQDGGEEQQDRDDAPSARPASPGAAARVGAPAATVPAVPPTRQDRAASPKRIAERHFCGACLPLGRPSDPEVVVAMSETAVGGLAAAWNPWIGGALATVGLVRVGLRLVAGHRRRRRVPRPQAALALDPRIARLELTETLTGALHRTPDGCRTTVESASGKIELEAVWARADTKTVADHRRKHELGPDAEVAFSAGSLVVCGPGRLEFVDPHPDGGLPVIRPLRSTAADHEVLADAVGRGDPRWTPTVEYRIDEPEPGSAIPVWVTPALSPGSGGRALEIDVQWRLSDPLDQVADRTAVPQAKQIDELRLTVPAAWGDVEAWGGAEQLTTTQPVEGVREIAWERAEPKIDPSDRGRAHLTVAFERRIVDDEPDDGEGDGEGDGDGDGEGEGDQTDVAPVVTGTLTMTFTNALSGATAVQVHAAGGARRLDGASSKCKIRTKVEVDLHLDLSDLRYQDVRTVPDPIRDATRQRREHREFPDVVPDHQTVALLTDVLSDQGYYVKTVVENPAQAGREPGTFDRFWDITGRRYNGVHPVNFHLVITGEEVRPPARRRSSSTTVRLVVWGTYATRAMEHEILDEQEQLWERIRACLDPDDRAPAEPVDASTAEVARLRNAALTLRTRLQTARRSGEPAESVLPGLVRFVDDEFGLTESDR